MKAKCPARGRGHCCTPTSGSDTFVASAHKRQKRRAELGANVAAAVHLRDLLSACLLSRSSPPPS